MDGWEHGVKGTSETWETAHQLRGRLAAIIERVQLMRRQERDGSGVQPLAADFATVDAAIGRLVTRVERIED
jgi:hypothetical protein